MTHLHVPKDMKSLKSSRLRDHVAADSDGNGVAVSMLFEQLCTAMQSAGLSPIIDGQASQICNAGLLILHRFPENLRCQ